MHISRRETDDRQKIDDKWVNRYTDNTYTERIYIFLFNEIPYTLKVENETRKVMRSHEKK